MAYAYKPNPEYPLVRECVLYCSIMPYSEVCMHMQIAGKLMLWRLLPGGRMVQLYTLVAPGDLRNYSIPITTGEAGLYDVGAYVESGERYYYHCPPTSLADSLVGGEAC